MIVKYKLNCYFGGVTDSIPSATVANHLFKSIYNLCNSLTSSGVTTRIAYNTGSNGAGTGYSDSANPFGNNAWACWRFNQTGSRDQDFYFLAQYASASGNFGDSPGNPGLINGTAEAISSNEGVVAVSMAAMVNTDNDSVNPWNGTTNNDGTDSKGDPVWEKSTSTDRLYVLPRSNNFDGLHSDSRENMGEILASTTGTPSLGVHLAGSQDGIAMAYYTGVADATVAVQYWGTYQALPNLSSSIPCSIIMWTKDIDTPTALTADSEIGNTDGNSVSFEGGVAVVDGTYSGRVDLLTDNAFQGDRDGWQPTRIGGPSPILLAPFAVGVEDDTVSYRGLLGYITSNLVRYSANIGSNTVSSDKEFCIFNTTGDSTSNNFAMKWHPSASMPGSGRTKEGEDF